MSRTPTIKDVAKRAGVSTATVSNVFNRPGRVAASTRSKVLAAVDETGFIRNASASRLRALDNRAIGVLVIDIGNEFQAAVAKGAQTAAEVEGYTTMLCDGDRDIERTVRHVDFLESQRVAGVLATMSSVPEVGARLDALRRRGVELVLVDAASDDPSQCSVAVDDVEGGRLVGAHLRALGRRRIAFVQPDVAFRPFADRLAGLRSAFDDLRAARIVEVLIPFDQIDDGRHAVDRALADGCDAIVCGNDQVAFAALRELTLRGVGVPDDIALVGYDDTPLSAMTAVPLTTVRQPAKQVGETAARLLLEKCTGGPHEHRHVMFRPELVVRGSTVSA
jgi:LacI family transcriptional regulator